VERVQTPFHVIRAAVAKNTRVALLLIIAAMAASPVVTQLQSVVSMLLPRTLTVQSMYAAGKLQTAF
jgi:hypothetical protein